MANNQAWDGQKKKEQAIHYIFLRLIHICLKIKPFYTVSLVSLKILLALVPAVQIYIVALLVEAVTVVITSGLEHLPAAYMALFLQLLLLLTQLALGSLERLLMSYIQVHIQFYLEQEMSQKATKLPLVYFDQSQFYDQIQRSMSSYSSFGILQQCFAIIQSSITVISIIGVLFTFHWSLALGVFLIAIPTYFVNARIGRQRYGQMYQQTPRTRKVQYIFQLLTGREAAKEIRLFQLASYLMHKWKGLFWKNAHEQLSLEKRSTYKVFAIDGMGIILSTLMTGLLIWLGGLGRVNIGQYVALAQAITMTQSMIQQTTTSVAHLYQDALFAREIFRYVDLPEEEVPEKSLSFPTPIRQGIQVRGLSFQYPNHQAEVLQNISFDIDVGQTVAIVGDNGAGKTTLVKCLLGLYTPQEGSIAYDNISIEQMHPIDVRQHVTAIFQDFVRYQFTAKENVGFGRVEEMENIAWMETATAKSGADEVVRSLPEGMDSTLGPMFEGGKELSYGQWQKIALSRAFFRDAQVVVLDEPTASMDPMTEAEMFEQFIHLSEGKTTLLISHRLGICRAVDKILVLQQGKLVEEGTHEQLIDAAGAYAQMYKQQAKWYES